MTKEKAIKIHAQRRFAERTNTKLDKELAKEIVKQIQKGKLKLLKRQSNRITVWLYTIQDTDYKLYYDSDRHLIVTIVPIRSWLREWLRDKVTLSNL